MPASRNIKINKISNAESLEIAHAIRYEVFVKGQNCPAHLERANEEESIHFLAKVDDVPAGACRWRKTDNGY